MEIIEEAFPGMFMDTPEDEKTKLISCLGAFRQFWAGLSQESHEQCIRWILELVHDQHSPKRIFLYDCLAMAVETGLLPPRMVCESLINSDTLEWERTQLWALTFKLVRKIIGGVDYKGVRDLLKVIFDKILTIPNTVSSAVVQQLLAAREHISWKEMPLLLPSYFAVTEIKKLYPEGKLPHWSTNSECFTLPMGALVETIYGNGIMRIPLPGMSCVDSGCITPLPVNLLDSLTVNAKMSVDSTVLRLIIALGSSEVQPQFTRFLSNPKTVLSAESEELNRALILTLARATHVTGSDSIQGTWCKDILQTIMSFTPHIWALHTLSCFPGPLQFIKQEAFPSLEKKK